ncbi:protein-export chaperone SecB [Asticcacaulis sp. 201]|uniref:protein-export chaperone SecB n=1 Tax=Asticcacaulis sp. 201 TaxID=3028787 RepID=UPI002916B8B3|nr:protein-export chaperone SecB [Asticcacaulis sp. 201]MDV6331293.1 protein-export chaperone SecB [Asticcacaulis sp. 201]
MTQHFSIRQIYLKDLSFQAPSGAAIFTREWAPEVKVDMNVTHEDIPGGLTEVVLAISTVAMSSGNGAYAIEVLQAGVFQLSGFSAAERERVLMTKCPTILLPYARETIDTLLMKGRFPALILDPIDFEANYRP